MKIYFVLLVASLGVGLRADEVAVMKPIEAFSFQSFEIAATAFKEVEKHDFDLSGYEIYIMKSESSYLVLFEHEDSPHEGRGNLSGHVAFEVELAQEDLGVIRSGFVR